MSDPESRNEALLGNLLGESNEFGEPQSANEAILQNMLGANNVIREPQSRIEAMLKEILDGGGMGGADMTAYVKSANKTNGNLKWEFTQAGTFYVCVVASYTESSSTSVYKSNQSYTSGDAVTVTVVRNSSTLYAYKVVVEEGEAEDMVFTVKPGNTTAKIYYSAWTLCEDKYETAPFTVT